MRKYFFDEQGQIQSVECWAEAGSACSYYDGPCTPHCLAEADRLHAEWEAQVEAEEKNGGHV